VETENNPPEREIAPEDNHPRLREAEDLAAIGRAANSTLNLSKIYIQVANALENYVQFDRITISLTRDSGETERVFVSGIGERELPVSAITARPNESFTRNPDGSIIHTTISKSSNPASMWNKLGLKSWAEVIIPTPRGDLGFLSVRSKTENAYKDIDLERLNKAANQLAPAIVNAQLYEQTQQESELRNVLAELGRIATSTLDIGDVYDDVAKLIARVIPFERLAVASIQSGSGINQIEYATGTPMKSQLVGTQIILDQQITDYLNEFGKPVVVDSDFAKKFPLLEQYVQLGEKSGLKSWLVAPLIWEGLAIGSLALRHSKANFYKENHLKTAALISDQLSGAISSSLSYRKERRANEVQAALADLGRIATSTLDIGDVYDEIAETVSRVIPIDRLVVSSYENSGTIGVTEYVDGVPMADTEIGTKKAIPVDISEFIVKFRSPFIVDDVIQSQHPGIKYFSDAAKSSGLHSWLLAPLIWRDEIIGGLHFRHKKENIYDNDDLLYSGLIAQQISGAIANSLSYRKERRENEVQAALANISIVVSQDLELQRVYNSVADELSRLIHYDRLAIVLFDRETDDLTIDFARGVSPAGDTPGIVITRQNQNRTWRWHLDKNLETIPTERDIAMENLGLKSWIQAPTGMQPDGPDGFLSIRAFAENQYTNSDLELLTLIAKQITPSIQNARLYQQSLKLNEQRQRANALDEENIELQRIADARSEFLSTVSHELRTPLTSISAFADILARNKPENLDQAQIKQIEVIKRSTTSLTTLIDDLLDVSTADAQQLNLNRAPFSLNDLIAEFETGTTTTLQNKNQNLTIKNENENIWIDADRARITQILNNLISNASKYSPPKTEITLSATTNEGKLTIAITDHGNGIAPNDLPSVFAPFFRATDTKTRQQQGTGLGLTIVKTIVELHLGEIQIQSKLEKGTTVTFWIPGITPKPN
jgi:signal transduction histidine kinase